MPQPTATQSYIDIPLTTMMVAWMQDPAKYIAPQVFPTVPVQEQSGLFWKFNKGDWYRIAAKPRADATESAGSGYSLSTGQYYAEVEAIHKDVSDRQRANAARSGTAVDPDKTAARFVSSQLALRREQKWAQAFFVPGVWSGGTHGADLSGVAAGASLAAGTLAQWGLPEATPIEDIQTQVVAMAEATGYKPGVLVISPAVWKALVNNAEFLTRVQYGGTPGSPATLSLSALAAIFGVDEVLVAWGVSNTAQEGTPDAMSFMFGKSALLCHKTDAPSLEEPSAGYSITWTGYLGANAAGGSISSFRMPQIKADRLEGEIAISMQVVSPELGVFFNNIVA